MGPSRTESTHGDPPAAVVDLAQVDDGILRRRDGRGVVGLRGAGAYGAVGPTDLDLQAVGAQLS